MSTTVKPDRTPPAPKINKPEPLKACPKCQELLPDNQELWNTLHPREVMNSLSRRDNKTYICNLCGQVEALHDFSGESENRIIRRFYDLPLVEFDTGGDS